MQHGKACEFCNETKDNLKALKSKLICTDCIREITGNFKSSIDNPEKIENRRENEQSKRNSSEGDVKFNENISNLAIKANRVSVDLNTLGELNVDPEVMEELLEKVDESVGKMEELQKAINKFKESEK
ncbi:unnamed protein product [Dimorphilus gyrociliatus]|uniref:Uncharacterized protein n=1 Tax=Dimorphilus gyrociliatus TaxID=2664684 RepID=A0A7I8VRT9_9ANNE|nr:unnamed protein product [Dimorphilus gyrociliatus]